MSTKIGGLDSNPVQISTGRAVKHAETSGNASQAVSTESDAPDTHITSSARSLAALDQLVQGLPEINQARVDQVSSRLASGSYQIDSERIADKLLLAEQSLSRLK
ncbi:MAG: flagellar biosynthesis anti-sigma factor FlgM [Steroidobacteraceae bacterium]